MIVCHPCYSDEHPHCREHATIDDDDGQRWHLICDCRLCHSSSEFPRMTIPDRTDRLFPPGERQTDGQT